MNGEKSGVNRRPLLIGGLGVLGLAAITGLAFELPRVFRLKPRGPYDDLLEGVDDTSAASVVGHAALAGIVTFEPGKAAEALRARIGQGTLREAVFADARDDRLREVRGWVLPASLVQTCMLAATDA